MEAVDAEAQLRVGNTTALVAVDVATLAAEHPLEPLDRGIRVVVEEARVERCCPYGRLGHFLPFTRRRPRLIERRT